jgi:hypothetical protein
MLKNRRVKGIIVVKDTTDRIAQLATYSLMYLKKFDAKNGVLSKMNMLNMLSIRDTNQIGVITYAKITSVI